MTREQVLTYYKENLTVAEKSISAQQNKLRFTAFLRLFSVVAAVFFLVNGIRNDHHLLFLITGLFTILFFALVIFHKHQSDRLDLLNELKKLNAEELEILEHRFSERADGSNFKDPHHPWSHDLDLFGSGSLYQFINRTSTITGSNYLADLLTRTSESAETVRTRQECTRSMRNRSTFRQLYTATARLFNEEKDDIPSLERWKNAEVYTDRNKWLQPVAVIISLLSLGIGIAGIIDYTNFSYYLPLLFLNWGLMSPFVVKNNRYHENISKKAELMDRYSKLLQLIASEDLETETWGNSRDIAKKGAREIKRLSSLLGLFDQRLNMVIGILLNSLFLFDIHMVFLLERWKRTHSAEMMQWIDVTGEVEAFITLGGFAFNHPDYVFPVLEEGKRSFTAKELGHPLIPEKKRISNDLVIDREKVAVITGANMAGKSTFLRSVGINMVLAYSGAPVCASTFSTGLLTLFSSMRTSDSLKDEESYFLAEIRRLKEVVVMMEKGTPMLILLDEVLKGTNTTDKQLGAIGLIKKTLKYEVLEFIATHDLVLGNLEKDYPGEVINYSFESYIEELELVFDYKIRRGIARNMNASFLMKKMGLME